MGRGGEGFASHRGNRATLVPAVREEKRVAPETLASAIAKLASVEKSTTYEESVGAARVLRQPILVRIMAERGDRGGWNIGESAKKMADGRIEAKKKAPSDEEATNHANWWAPASAGGCVFSIFGFARVVDLRRLLPYYLSAPAGGG